MFHILNCGFAINLALIIGVMNVQKPEIVRISTGFEPVP